jgi:hypothetical protein
MPKPTLSDAQALALVAKASAQIDDYVKLSGLASVTNSRANWAYSPNYSWNNPTRIVVLGENNVVLDGANDSV